jgi:Transcriptional regulatory protein, C terminal
VRCRPCALADVDHRIVGDGMRDSRCPGRDIELQEPGAVPEVSAVGDRRHFARMHHHVGETSTAACGHPLSETIPVVEQFDAVAIRRDDRLQIAALRVDRRHGDDIGEQRSGSVVSREELVHEVWHDAAPSAVGVSVRTVDTHVRRLRVKLGRYQAVLTSVRGLGYRFERRPDVRVFAGSATA